VDTETGEFGERRLTHREEAEEFYNTLKERKVRVRNGSQRARTLVDEFVVTAAPLMSARYYTSTSGPPDMRTEEP
jgi:hypothetical protein